MSILYSHYSINSVISQYTLKKIGVLLNPKNDKKGSVELQNLKRFCPLDTTSKEFVQNRLNFVERKMDPHSKY